MQPNAPQPPFNPYYPQNAPVQQPGQLPMPQPPMPIPTGKPPEGKSAMPWIIAMALLSVLLIAALVFGFWAYGQMQDYKNHSDTKVAAAVKVAEQQTADKDKAAFALESQNPLKTYTGPDAYGSISVQYPKTWSAYISTANNGSTVLDGYFHPDFVPNLTASSNGAQAAVALHMQVLSQSYDSVVTQSKSSVDNGDLQAAPYALPLLPSIVGLKLTGKLPSQLTGTQIILPLRDKTLVLTTNTDQYLHEFNDDILANLTFEP